MTLTAWMRRGLSLESTLLPLAMLLGSAAPLAAQTPATPPSIVSASAPRSGEMMILFHGATGPFQVQTRNSLEAAAPWFDVVAAKVTEVQTGVFMALFPMGPEDVAFYRVLSEGEVVADLKGWGVLIQVSAPANHQYFVTGERPVITVTLLDNFAQGVTRDALSTLALYMDGPQDPRVTVTPVKLLNVTADRTKTPHHYLNLKTATGLQINGDVLTYTLQPVSDEAPGTYTAAVRAVLGTDPLQQIMKFVDLQIGTNTVETPVVTKTSCTPCHQGTISGKMYMHHIDPSGTSLGNWSYDYEPVRSCKACHNNDGYAAYNDASVTGGKVSDPIVRRVHGVHMGELLSSDFSTNAVTGDFRDYTKGAFPADVRNCAVCHQDDRWKTVPTRLACGSCHDNTWFGPVAQKPAGRMAHLGGAWANDSVCAVCHDTTSITEDHLVSPPVFQQKVTLTMTAPANSKYYVAGEAPQLSIKILNATNGLAINPTNLVDPLVSTTTASNEWKRANLFVSGPRADTVPVLTTAAVLAATNVSYANNELRYMRNPSQRDPRITWTADAILYQLSNVASLAAGTYTVFVDVMPATFPGGWAYLNFQVGTTNIEPLVAGNCITCHGDTRMHDTSRAVPMIPDICKS